MEKVNQAGNTPVAGNSERVYSLDALRGIMMLLGIVIHSAITYTKIDYGSAWPLKDPNNSILFDMIIGLIHAFRMPVFFVAAGFFGALLFYKKGPNAMLANRFRRILLPFIAGVLITYPLISAAFTFSRSSFEGLPDPLGNAWGVLVNLQFLPFNVAHLWFLYFLAMYAVVGWFLAMIFNKQTAFTSTMNSGITYVLKSFWLRLIVMTVLYFLCLYWMKSTGIKTNNKWSVDPEVFVLYFVFFGTGWMIYKTGTLSKLSGYPVWQLLFATVLSLAPSFIPWPAEPWVLHIKQLCTALSGSLFIFGFMALFITYFSSYSSRLNYLMDSAYWIYIIHLPIVSFIPGLMAGLSISPFLKFAITLSVTGAICMLSYKYLVRGSFIGKFLNGKVYKPKKIQPAPELVVQ